MSPPGRAAGRPVRCSETTSTAPPATTSAAAAVAGFDVIGSHLAHGAALTAPAQVPGTVKPVVHPER